MEAKIKLLHVIVRYAAAEKPFEEKALPTENVGQLKTEVLKAFGLSEGSRPDGSAVTYTLYHDKTPLEDLNRTLGSIAGEKETLHLNLVQQITQGRKPN